MATLQPYLLFDGTCEAAFTLYQRVFGGEFGMIQRFREIPPEAKNFDDDEGEKLMHVALRVGDTTLMGSDCPRRMLATFIPGTNYQLSFEASSRLEVDKIFTALADGGVVRLAPADTFWGAYFGMVTDRYGIQWMIGYTAPAPTHSAPKQPAKKQPAKRAPRRR